MSDLSQIPYSTLLILCVSLVMSFTVSLINSHFTPREQRERLAALRREIAELNKKKNENLKKAKSTGDKNLLKKVRKQERQLLQLQSQMASLSLRQMKIMPITMTMFLLVWMFLTGRLLYWPVLPGLFTGAETVAKLPWISGEMPLNLFWWYLLSSLLFGIFFSRIFGLTGATE
ncbi:MAG: EMC3/TMCO1 family protein [Candidatus Bathyarchaeia archaeon]